jgi:hypothetical protein
MTIDINNLENNTDEELIEVSEGMNQYGTPSKVKAKIIYANAREKKKNLKGKRPGGFSF